MIIKVIGMVIVLASSGLIGFSFAECMASRERELVNLSHMIDNIINELEFTMAPIGEIIKTIACRNHGKANTFMQIMCQELERGHGVADAWKCALEKSGPSMSFKQSDCKYLSSSGFLLESYEIEEQLERLRTLKTRILSLAEEAKKEKDKNSRTVRMMGIYAGLLLCVIIF